jgi:hypothetical protein
MVVIHLDLAFRMRTAELFRFKLGHYQWVGYIAKSAWNLK